VICAVIATFSLAQDNGLFIRKLGLARFEHRLDPSKQVTANRLFSLRLARQMSNKSVFAVAIKHSLQFLFPQFVLLEPILHPSIDMGAGTRRLLLNRG
jgi:hypothetical protein